MTTLPAATAAHEGRRGERNGEAANATHNSPGPFTHFNDGHLNISNRDEERDAGATSRTAARHAAHKCRRGKRECKAANGTDDSPSNGATRRAFSQAVMKASEAHSGSREVLLRVEQLKNLPKRKLALRDMIRWLIRLPHKIWVSMRDDVAFEKFFLGQGRRNKVSGRHTAQRTDQEEHAPGIEAEAVAVPAGRNETPENSSTGPALHRPAIQRPAIQRPAIQRPAIQRPAIQRPAIQQPDSERTDRTATRHVNQLGTAHRVAPRPTPQTTTMRFPSRPQQSIQSSRRSRPRLQTTLVAESGLPLRVYTPAQMKAPLPAPSQAEPILVFFPETSCTKVSQLNDLGAYWTQHMDPILGTDGEELQALPLATDQLALCAKVFEMVDSEDGENGDGENEDGENEEGENEDGAGEDGEDEWEDDDDSEPDIITESDSAMS